MQRRLFLFALAVARPAAAADGPATFPLRDATVAYSAGDRGMWPMTFTMSWAASPRRQRLDFPGGWTVVDFAEPSGFMATEENRIVMPLLPDELRRLEAPPGGSLVREGEEAVLGHPCTIWRRRRNAEDFRLWLTADGVLLRARNMADGRSAGMEALALSQAPHPPGHFQIPEGYRLEDRPG